MKTCSLSKQRWKVPKIFQKHVWYAPTPLLLGLKWEKLLPWQHKLGTLRLSSLCGESFTKSSLCMWQVCYNCYLPTRTWIDVRLLYRIMHHSTLHISRAYLWVWTCISEFKYHFTYKAIAQIQNGGFWKICQNWAKFKQLYLYNKVR